MALYVASSGLVSGDQIFMMVVICSKKEKEKETHEEKKWKRRSADRGFKRSENQADNSTNYWNDCSLSRSSVSSRCVLVVSERSQTAYKL